MKKGILIFSLLMVLTASGITALAAEPEVLGQTQEQIEGSETEEIPVREEGILVQTNKIYYGQYDAQQEGVLKLQDAKLKYYVDGKFQSKFSGRLSEDTKGDLNHGFGVSFYVKNGIVDTSFQGIVTICNTDGTGEGSHFYVVNGIISNSLFESDPDDPSASMCSDATGLSIKNTADGISVGYNKNTYGNDRGFYIYRLCHETGEFVFFAKLDGSSTGFVDKNVEINHTYTYYIWTYNFYDMWHGGGYLCGFVDLSIVYGGDDTGKTNTFKGFMLPEDSAAADIEWNLSDDGVLTVWGNGTMPDYNKSDAPWVNEKNNITSVIIEDGITAVGEAAFYECWNLESVKLACSVEDIRSGAFYNCTNLKTVELAEGLRMINDYAFEGTNSLTTIRLPASLGKISPIAFCNAGLQRYEVAEESDFMVQDGILFNSTGTVLLSYPCGLEKEIYRIPPAVTVIDKSAFQYVAVKFVEIPDNVKTIKRSAFLCSSIEKISIPDSVIEVGEFTLSKCTALKELRIGSGIKSLPFRFAEGCSSLETLLLNEGLGEVGMHAFRNCDSLKKLTVPSSVKKIDSSAFISCTLLENVSFNEGIKRIEATAFYETALSSVNLPASLTYIERNAFPKNCSLNFSEGSKLNDFGGYYQRVYEAQIEAEYNYDMAFQVLEQVNQKRRDNGLEILKMDEELLDAAMLRATEISIYFDHERPSGKNFSTVNGKAMGENIAAGNSTAVSVMNSWMNSTGHRNNILGAGYAGIGIGCVKVNGIYYWVQLFSSSEADLEADGNNKQNISEVTSVLFDKDGNAAKGFSVSVENNMIKKEDKTNILVYFYNGYRYTQLYSESISFSSSDQSVVTVSPEGEVTGVGKGTAEVTAYLTKDPEICGIVTITVENVSSTEGDGTGDVENENPSEEDTSGAENKNPSEEDASGAENKNPFGGDASDGGQIDNNNGNKPDGTGTQDTGAIKGTLPSVGTTKKLSTGIYKITKSSTTEKTVTLTRPANTKKTSVMIPATVKIEEQTYKVTEIAPKAFKNSTKLKSVTIGKNITKIGKEAFSGCKQLKKITVKSTVLKSVGKNAVKNIHKKATIKVPKKKLAAYRKLFNSKTGFKKSMHVKK